MAQTCDDPPTRTFWTRGATPRRIHHLQAGSSIGVADSWHMSSPDSIFRPVRRVNNSMVYDAKTLVVLHRLTPDGEERYRQFLEDEGTRILYRAQHPVKYYAGVVVGALKRLLGR